MQGCAASFPRKDFAQHYDLCDNVKFQCTECLEECPKREKATHSCIKVMKGKIDAQQKLIEELTRKVD
jgi:hypothetical protein